MKIAIGSDHGGFYLKKRLIPWLKKRGYSIKDFGTYSKESCDYPLITYSVAKAVSEKKYTRGIVICKSGIGNSIVANKLPRIRAALCLNAKMAELSRRHNNANILVLAANFNKLKTSKKIVDRWLRVKFQGARHLRRIKQILDIERRIIADSKL